MPKNVKEEKEMVVDNDKFLTHEMLIILIHECWKLIKSDF